MGGFAQAKEQAPSATANGQPAVAGPAPSVKVLYVCGEDEASWRSVSSDLGLPEFVTAKKVRADKGKAWDAPRCISPAELRRLTDVEVGRLTATSRIPIR
ncbi:MAG: hypothetical protein DI570_22550 [Phenylobacterium zucineum]|nr:MAG: hypothetical protein DI570_22550 [Phenylobacterium zucineum]